MQRPGAHPALLSVSFLVLIFIFNHLKDFEQHRYAMEQRMSIITLGVNDLERSITFYEDILGWKRSEFSNDQIIFFELNDFFLSLYGRDKLAEDAATDPSGNGFKGFTLSYLTRSEKEVDDLIDGLRNKGVKIVKEPQEVFWGGYSSYISDPDGYLWEIAFNPYVVPK